MAIRQHQKSACRSGASMRVPLTPHVPSGKFCANPPRARRSRRARRIRASEPGSIQRATAPKRGACVRSRHRVARAGAAGSAGLAAARRAAAVADDGTGTCAIAGVGRGSSAHRRAVGDRTRAIFADAAHTMAVVAMARSSLGGDRCASLGRWSSASDSPPRRAAHDARGKSARRCRPESPLGRSASRIGRRGTAHALRREPHSRRWARRTPALRN